jgi:alkylation response protein AidB-like acyl-CoA dehydrogenase
VVFLEFARIREFESPLERYMAEIIRDWGEKYVIPHRRNFDEDWKEHRTIEPALEKLMVDYGIQTAVWPEEFGGWGLGSSDYFGSICARVMEEIGRYDTGIAVSVGVTLWPIFVIAVKPHINYDLCAEFAPLFMRKKLTMAANAMTEPQGGSDIENLDELKGKTIRTTAKLDGDEWVINGHKLWPTNSGGVADLFGVVCTTNPGVPDEKNFAYIYVPADLPGVKQGEPYRKAGMAADKNSDIWFENVRVPKRYRAWGEGLDAKYFRIIISTGCLGSAGMALGAMENIYEILFEKCSELRYRGRPLKENTAVAAVLADIAAEIEICRSAVYTYARMLDRPDYYGNRFSAEMIARGRALKLKVCDACCRVAERAMDLLGHYGIDRNYDVEKHWRDVKIIQLWMGGRQLCQMDVARYFYDCKQL